MLASKDEEAKGGRKSLTPRAGAGAAPAEQGCCRLRALGVEEGLIDVGDDVFDVFDTDGKAHEAFGDTDAFADFWGHGGVCNECRERDERFDAAEAFGERAEFYLIEEAASRVLGFEIESQH